MCHPPLSEGLLKRRSTALWVIILAETHQMKIPVAREMTYYGSQRNRENDRTVGLKGNTSEEGRAESDTPADFPQRWRIDFGFGHGDLLMCDWAQ